MASSCGLIEKMTKVKCVLRAWPFVGIQGVNAVRCSRLRDANCLIWGTIKWQNTIMTLCIWGLVTERLMV